MLKVAEQRTDKKSEENVVSSSNTTTNSTGTATTLPQVKVNKTIQMLAQQYCTECKISFEELSKIIQRVLVSRKELVAYDRRHRDAESAIKSDVQVIYFEILLKYYLLLYKFFF